MLGDGHRDAHDVHLLEAVAAQQRHGHVAGDGDERCGIHERRGKAGDQIGGPGAGRGHHDAGAPGGAGIAVGGVARALLVGGQHVPYGAVGIQRVVEVDDLATGVAEHRVHALLLKAFDEDL